MKMAIYYEIYARLNRVEKQRRRNLVQPRIHPRRRLKNLSKIIKIEAYRTYYHSLRGYR